MHLRAQICQDSSLLKFKIWQMITFSDAVEKKGLDAYIMIPAGFKLRRDALCKPRKKCWVLKECWCLQSGQCDDKDSF